MPHAPARSLLPSFPYHFHPGLPDLAGFPRDRWLRSLRAALRESPLDGGRAMATRAAFRDFAKSLADYVARVRGAAPTPENLVICTGFVQGFSLVCRLLRRTGSRRLRSRIPVGSCIA